MSIKSISKPFLWWCAVVTVITLSCIIVYRTGFALYHNYQLHKEFSVATNPSPYQQGIPMEKMDLTAYADYFPKTFTAVGYRLTHRIKTPATLHYYDKIPTDDSAAVLEIDKGTTIVAIPEWTTGSLFYEVGYGYTSFPTYEKGWRYVRPFVTAEGLDKVHSDHYYYVKIDSLEAVLDKVMAENQPFIAGIRQQGWTLNKGKHTIARFIDNALYQHGAYLSPDLFYRVFDRWNAILLGSIAVIIALLILGRGNRLSSFA